MSRSPTSFSAGAAARVLGVAVFSLRKTTILVVLAAADHGVAADVDPEADAFVGGQALHDVLGGDVPEDDVAVLAGGGDEGAGAAGRARRAGAGAVAAVLFVAVAAVFAVVLAFMEDAEAAADAVGRVAVALVRLAHGGGVGDVVPRGGCTSRG